MLQRSGPRVALFSALTFLVLGAMPHAPASATTITFFSPAPIAIPGSGDSGPGAPYPSTITVSGLTDPIVSVTVTIFGLSHTSIADVGMLLVGPGGQSVVLMDFVGSGEIVNMTYIFDDAAADFMPFTGAPSSGSYKPTAYDADGNIVAQSDTFDPPAPSSGYSASGLSVFSGLDPNGVYSLFVEDFIVGDVGVLANGWAVTLTTGVAEPSSFMLLGAGIGLIAIVAWRRENAADRRRRRGVSS
jgi:subtilisin-like proprotein convertase family protein